MATEGRARYGFYKDKLGQGYLALDDGDTYVKPVAYSLPSQQEAMILTGLANDAISIRDRTDWRAKLARWLLFREDGWS